MTASERLSLLVVEDEILVALALEDILQSAGYRVLGPARTLAEALEAANGASFDMALLDINLGGEKAFPVADLLAAQGRPFVFLSGASGADLPAHLADRPRLIKPFASDALLEIIHRTFGMTASADLSWIGRT